MCLQKKPQKNNNNNNKKATPNNLTSISFLFASYKSSFVAIPFKTISICWPASNMGCVSSSHLSLKMPASTDLNENGILTVFPGRTTPKKIHARKNSGYTPQIKLSAEVFQCKVRLSNEIQTFFSKKLLFHQFLRDIKFNILSSDIFITEL